ARICVRVRSSRDLVTSHLRDDPRSVSLATWPVGAWSVSGRRRISSTPRTWAPARGMYLAHLLSVRAETDVAFRPHQGFRPPAREWAPFPSLQSTTTSRGGARAGPSGELSPQLTAFFTSAPILASSAAVSSVSAKAAGH